QRPPGLQQLRSSHPGVRSASVSTGGQADLLKDRLQPSRQRCMTAQLDEGCTTEAQPSSRAQCVTLVARGGTGPPLAIRSWSAVAPSFSRTSTAGNRIITRERLGLALAFCCGLRCPTAERN